VARPATARRRMLSSKSACDSLSSALICMRSHVAQSN